MGDFNDLISHPPSGKLKAHLEQVTNIINNRLKNFDVSVFDSDYLSSIEITAKLHDIGKATIYFQQYIKTKDAEKRRRLKNKPETHHAMVSAVIAFTEARKRKLSLKLSIFIYLAIRYHHTNLSTPVDAFTLDEFDYKTLELQISSIDCWQQIINELDLCLNVEDINSAPAVFKHDIRKIRRQIKLNYFVRDDYFNFLGLEKIEIEKLPAQNKAAGVKNKTLNKFLVNREHPIRKLISKPLQISFLRNIILNSNVVEKIKNSNKEDLKYQPMSIEEKEFCENYFKSDLEKLKKDFGVEFE